MTIAGMKLHIKRYVYKNHLQRSSLTSKKKKKKKISTVRAEAILAWISATMQQRWDLQKSKTRTKGYDDEMGDDLADLTLPGTSNNAD
jgi:hypothetical protein